MNKVSIIVPVYNVGEYVEECLDSIYKQTYSDIEVIIIDDGSTDNSSIVIEKYIKDKKKFKYFYQINNGLSSARNHGLQKSSGEYVCFIDSDDWIEKTYIEKMVEELKYSNADVCVCGYQRITDTKKIKQKIIPSDKTYTIKAEALQFYTDTFIENKYGITACNKLYKKNVIEKNNIFFEKNSEIYAEDLLFNNKIIFFADTIVCLSDILYNYRIREGSITQSKKENLVSRYSELFNRLSVLQQSKYLKNSEMILSYVLYESLNVICIEEYKYNKNFAAIYRVVKQYIKETKNFFEYIPYMNDIDKHSKHKKTDIYLFRKILYFPLEKKCLSCISLLYYIKNIVK